MKATMRPKMMKPMAINAKMSGGVFPGSNGPSSLVLDDPVSEDGAGE